MPVYLPKKIEMRVMCLMLLSTARPAWMEAPTVMQVAVAEVVAVVVEMVEEVAEMVELQLPETGVCERLTRCYAALPA